MSTRIVATACVLALVLGCSSDESPFTPRSVHYNIYAAGSWYGYAQTDSSTMYIYDADSLTLIDSLVFPHIADEAVASPDGRYLYILFWPYYDAGLRRYIAKLDLASRSILWSTEVQSGTTLPRLLDNGRLLVCDPEVIDPETGRVLRRMDDSVFDGWRLANGSSTGTEVAAILQDTVPHRGWDSAVVAIDVLTGERRGWFVPRIGPGQPPLGLGYARLHPDGRRVLCSGAVYDVQNAWFVVGDLNTGEQLLSARLSTPSSEIAISEDGTLAVVVDQASPGFGYGWPAVYVYDLVHYQHLATFDSDNGLTYWPGRIQFLPGDRRVAMMPDNDAIVTGWLQTFDLESLTPEFVVDTPWFEPFVGAFTVGPRTN